MKSIGIGLAGLGTVGGGTIDLLKENKEEIKKKAGGELNVVGIADIDTGKIASKKYCEMKVFTDAMQLLELDEVEVVVELIGGETFAKDFVISAINSGKHIVTANKALLAKHGNEIFDLATRKNVFIGYEAAIAGGIPVVKALREGLSGNNITWIAGILNGTTNFILSEMENSGASFDDALAQATALGYAELDPTLDIDGYDSAHKIALLSSIAFGVKVDLASVSVSGIRNLSLKEVSYAKQLGYRIKLLAVTRKVDGKIELNVAPSLIPLPELMSNIDGAMNAVEVRGDFVGQTLYYGQGAGAKPTASSVVADLIDIARFGSQSKVPAFSYQPEYLKTLTLLTSSSVIVGRYVRLKVLDEPGVLASITSELAKNDVSIDCFFQKKVDEKEGCTDVILLTHPCSGKNISQSMSEISKFDTVVDSPVILRVESFQ